MSKITVVDGKYVSPFGKREGLADRLLEHIQRLGCDKSLSWPGLGLLADLRAASDAIKGVPEVAPSQEEYDL